MTQPCFSLVLSSIVQCLLYASLELDFCFGLWLVDIARYYSSRAQCEHILLAVAILLSAAFYPWNLICLELL